MKKQDKGMVLGCLGILLWFVANFFLPGACFNTWVYLNDDIGLDLLLSFLIGIIGSIVLGLSNSMNNDDDEHSSNSRLPQFTLSAFAMIGIYSVAALLIIGFTDIEPVAQKQLGKKILIYIIYCGCAIIVDILEANGTIRTLTKNKG